MVNGVRSMNGSKTKLNMKQQKFCQEYIKDLNATQAYLRAYRPKKESTARINGCKLLANTNISQKINELQSERAKELKIDANWVLQRLKYISDRCVQAEPALDHSGNPTGEYRFDAAGAIKATELIGKHLGMFKDKVEHTGNLGVGVKKLEDFFK